MLGLTVLEYEVLCGIVDPDPGTVRYATRDEVTAFQQLLAARRVKFVPCPCGEYRGAVTNLGLEAKRIHEAISILASAATA
jgi:hypothetical protein